MAPLAGTPPFAIDEPGSVFADHSQPDTRLRKQKAGTTTTGGARDSAYTAFDSYFTGGGPDTRVSGVGDIGRGLLDAGSDYDDSSDDEHLPKSKQAPSATEHPSDKHHALYAAATGALSDPPPPPNERNVFASTQEHEPQPQAQHPASLRVIKQPQPVAHARGNDGQMERPLEASARSSPIARSVPQQQRVPPAVLQSGIRPVAAPAPAHSRPPQVAFMQDPTPHMAQTSPNSQGNPYFTGMMPGGPGHTMRTPQPLPPPQSPIMPVFARPRKESSAIKFEDKGAILRGNSEETLLPRGVGGKGDEFWRRFSMVAKEEAKSGSKKSAWLRKTESGSTRLSTWVWLVGILLLLAIGGGIGVGWFFTHNKPASPPVAIGGSADEGFTTSTSSPTTAVSTKATRVTAAPEPTNTNNNNNNNKRSVDHFVPMLAPNLHAVPTVPAAHRRLFVDRMPH